MIFFKFYPHDVIIRRAFFLVFLLSSFIKTAHTQSIIVLNGTSSAGKSSLANELSQLIKKQKSSFETPDISSALDPSQANNIDKDSVQIISLDGVYNAMVANMIIKLGLPHKTPIPYEEITKFYETLKTHTKLSAKRIENLQNKLYKDAAKQLYAEAKHLYAQGVDVIVDTLAFAEHAMNDMANAFDKLKTLYVLVYCPMEKLLEHILMRNQSKNTFEHRDTLLPFIQFSSWLYEVTNNKKLSVGTFDPQQFHAIISDYTKSEDPDVAIAAKKIQEKEGAAATALGCTVNSPAQFITTRHQNNYHLIVNTEKNSPAECAQQIVNSAMANGF